MCLHSTQIFEHEESSYHTTRVKWLLTVPERIKENVVDGGKYDAFKRVVIDSLFKWNPREFQRGFLCWGETHTYMYMLVFVKEVSQWEYW